MLPVPVKAAKLLRLRIKVAPLNTCAGTVTLKVDPFPQVTIPVEIVLLLLFYL